VTELATGTTTTTITHPVTGYRKVVKVSTVSGVMSTDEYSIDAVTAVST
jgi:hypothetical protein